MHSDMFWMVTISNSNILAKLEKEFFFCWDNMAIVIKSLFKLENFNKNVIGGINERMKNSSCNLWEI